MMRIENICSSFTSSLGLVEKMATSFASSMERTHIKSTDDIKQLCEEKARAQIEKTQIEAKLEKLEIESKLEKLEMQHQNERDKERMEFEMKVMTIRHEYQIQEVTRGNYKVTNTEQSISYSSTTVRPQNDKESITTTTTGAFKPPSLHSHQDTSSPQEQEVIPWNKQQTNTKPSKAPIMPRIHRFFNKSTQVEQDNNEVVTINPRREYESKLNNTTVPFFKDYIEERMYSQVDTRLIEHLLGFYLYEYPNVLCVPVTMNYSLELIIEKLCQRGHILPQDAHTRLPDQFRTNVWLRSTVSIGTDNNNNKVPRFVVFHENNQSNMNEIRKSMLFAMATYLLLAQENRKREVEKPLVWALTRPQGSRYVREHDINRERYYETMKHVNNLEDWLLPPSCFNSCFEIPSQPEVGGKSCHFCHISLRIGQTNNLQNHQPKSCHVVPFLQESYFTEEINKWYVKDKNNPKPDKPTPSSPPKGNKEKKKPGRKTNPSKESKPKQPVSQDSEKDPYAKYTNNVHSLITSLNEAFTSGLNPRNMDYNELFSQMINSPQTISLFFSNDGGKGPASLGLSHYCTNGKGESYKPSDLLSRRKKRVDNKSDKRPIDVELDYYISLLITDIQFANTKIEEYCQYMRSFTTDNQLYTIYTLSGSLPMDTQCLVFRSDSFLNDLSLKNQYVDDIINKYNGSVGGIACIEEPSFHHFLQDNSGSLIPPSNHDNNRPLEELTNPADFMTPEQQTIPIINANSSQQTVNLKQQQLQQLQQLQLLQQQAQSTESNPPPSSRIEHGPTQNNEYNEVSCPPPQHWSLFQDGNFMGNNLQDPSQFPFPSVNQEGSEMSLFHGFSSQ